MTVKISPHTSFVRFFDEGKEFGEDYHGSMVLTWHSPSSVEIDLASNKITRQDLIDLFKELLRLEVNTIISLRAGRRRPPGGKFIKMVEGFSMWETDVETTLKRMEKTCLI